MAVAARDPKRDNAVYHDAAAASYEGKWALSFEGVALDYVRERAERMLPARRYPSVLEVGCGTGFWLLNLWQCGFAERIHATDISTGMLAQFEENAGRLGVQADFRVADAERLPFGDATFDLVTGHAFLHHLPDPPAALAEMFRVLRPGGAIFLAGEPTAFGDRLAAVSKRAVMAASRVAGGLPALARFRKPASAPPRTEQERVLRDLEFAVDLHTFEPDDVARWARRAGFRRIRLETEELTASLFGWAVRTFEAEVRPGLLGDRWNRFAYRGWRLLYRLDEGLARFLPQRLFYNLLLYAEKPG